MFKKKGIAANILLISGITLGVLLIVVFFLFFSPLGETIAGKAYGFGLTGQTFSSCSTTPISTPGIHTLTTDITATNSVCFVITQDDVTLDCQGHKITGGSSSNIAIMAQGIRPTTASGVRIRNCVIEDFPIGKSS